jgi:hypothetical protein
MEILRSIIMKKSKPLYGIRDSEDFMGLVWETELGMVVTCEGKWNIQNNLQIISVETGEDVGNIDLRNVLMSLLPSK